MLDKHAYSQGLIVCAALLMAISAKAASFKASSSAERAMREKMAMMEKMELADRLE